MGPRPPAHSYRFRRPSLFILDNNGWVVQREVSGDMTKGDGWLMSMKMIKYYRRRCHGELRKNLNVVAFQYLAETHAFLRLCIGLSLRPYASGSESHLSSSFKDPLPDRPWVNTGRIRLLFSTNARRVRRQGWTNGSQFCPGP